MSEPNHQDYYVSRAATSRSLAERAANPMIAAIHAELARRYDALAAETAPRPEDRIVTVQIT